VVGDEPALEDEDLLLRLLEELLELTDECDEFSVSS
jgi:hypothetical protein